MEDAVAVLHLRPAGSRKAWVGLSCALGAHDDEIAGLEAGEGRHVDVRRPGLIGQLGALGTGQRRASELQEDDAP
jgi:hypothetical protein